MKEMEIIAATGSSILGARKSDRIKKWGVAMVATPH